MPGVVELRDGGRGGVGTRHVERGDLDRPAADAAVVVDEVGREHHAAVLVDPALALGAREGIDRADLDRIAVGHRTSTPSPAGRTQA